MPVAEFHISAAGLRRRFPGVFEDTADAFVTLSSDQILKLLNQYPSDAIPLTAGTDSHGPGTELKALLKRVGIVASPGCSCNTRAKLMDANELKEPGWCEQNLETI